MDIPAFVPFADFANRIVFEKRFAQASVFAELAPALIAHRFEAAPFHKAFSSSSRIASVHCRTRMAFSLLSTLLTLSIRP